MEPQIQYAKTSDGVNIAFSVSGEGHPYVFVTAWPTCHLEASWKLPTWRHVDERIAAHAMLVRMDTRGAGLSQRDVDDLSLRARVLDLEAVVDRLGLESFDLCAYSTSGPVAVEYAARHPERVDHLILSDSFARATDALAAPSLQGLIAMANSDWDMFTEAIASVVFGWTAGDEARKMAAYIRECVTPEQGRAAMAAAFASDVDVTERLAEVQAPTLVTYFRDSAFPGVDAARSLASALPNATLVGHEGTWITTNEIAEASVNDQLDFLGARGRIGQQAGVDTHTILFTDVENSTALTDRLGDAKARGLLREHERITREALNEHGGSEVKTMGDGFMASFGSATKALECAVAMQQAFARHNESTEEPINVRIGLNAGEPIAEDDPEGRGDLFGTAVNMAARIAARAEGGEILASNVVRELVAGKDFLFNDRGDTELRGFEDPVRLYEVSWREK
ncbi:MAG TPA: adenylate/guanylate cyclase domain-containing protein [Dehalococcoidia bacterium]